MPFFGVCYSPYHRRNDRSGVTENDVDADMAMISSKGFTHIRTYSAEDGDPCHPPRHDRQGMPRGFGDVTFDPDTDPEESNPSRSSGRRTNHAA
jgi:hypothetical protein